MSRSPQERPLSQLHLYLAAPVLGLAFTYTGVEESLWEAIMHPEFQINWVLNSLQVLIASYFPYRFHFIKKFPFWKSLLLSLLMFYLLQAFMYAIMDYEPDDILEIYTIALPFGSIILLLMNILYHLIRKQADLKEELESKKDPLTEKEEIWLDTSKGRISLRIPDILYAMLTDTHLEIKTKEESIRSFYSVKQLEELLENPAAFFRVNKQCLSSRQAIKAYKGLKDGRLELSLEGGLTCLVSKNKASSLKKWLNEAS